MAEEIKFSKELMDKYALIVLSQKQKWRKQESIYYKLDWRNTKLINLKNWFKTCLVEAQKNQGIIDLCKDFSVINDVDERAVNILEWITKNIKYKSDSLVWNVKEKWQTPVETFNLKTGDCEDGSLLLATFLFLSGVSPKHWDVVCGRVKTGEGHSWLNYYAKLNAKTYSLDWCYYPDIKRISRGRTCFFDNKYYADVWFGFNNENSWKGVKNPYKYFSTSWFKIKNKYLFNQEE